MRQGNKGPGVFAGNFEPPHGWRTLTLRLRSRRDKLTRRTKEKECTIGALSNEELNWLSRVVRAELERRADALTERRIAMVPATAIKT